MNYIGSFMLQNIKIAMLTAVLTAFFPMYFLRRKFFIYYSVFVTRYSLLAAFYWLLETFYSLLVTFYSSPVTFYLLLTAIDVFKVCFY